MIYEGVPDDEEGFRHFFIIDAKDDLLDAVEWCESQFGDPGIGRQSWSYHFPDLFMFKRSEDAFSFKMRWG